MKRPNNENKLHKRCGYSKEIPGAKQHDCEGRAIHDTESQPDFVAYDPGKGNGHNAIDGMRAVAFMLDEIEVMEEVWQMGERMEIVLEEMEARCVSMVDNVATTMGQLLEEVKDKVKSMVAEVHNILQSTIPRQVTYAVVAGRAI